MKEYEDIKEEFWKPEMKGDAVNGVLVSIKNGVGKHKATLYSLQKEKGNIVHVWSSRVLDEKMVAIQTGDDIRIIYEGKVKPEGGGREYHNYKVQRIK